MMHSYVPNGVMLNVFFAVTWFWRSTVLTEHSIIVRCRGGFLKDFGFGRSGFFRVGGSNTPSKNRNGIPGKPNDSGPGLKPWILFFEGCCLLESLSLAPHGSDRKSKGGTLGLCFHEASSAGFLKEL